MSEKLCLQWNDFKENTTSVFGSLREDKDFADVTLAFEDGQQIVAHKVILMDSSPLFKNILIGNKHSQPLIYLRGWKSVDIYNWFYIQRRSKCFSRKFGLLSLNCWGASVEGIGRKGKRHWVGTGLSPKRKENSNSWWKDSSSKTRSRIQNSRAGQSLLKWRARGEQQININDDQNFKEKPMRETII